LISAVEAPVIIATKEGSIAKRWGEVIEHSAIQGNDGLNNEF
jgi:hypothetical protein